jgi:phytoene dehydrogenase-like protein
MANSSSDLYDAIIIGGGHNGLVAAAYLAKAGQRVLVLEKRAVLGGAAATESLFPGYRLDTGAADAGLFMPRIVQDLDLEKHGLRFLQGEAVLTQLLPGGRSLILWRDQQRLVEEIARFSSQDAARFPLFCETVSSLAEILAEIMVQSPPSLPNIDWRELWPWRGVAFKAKRLSQAHFYELLRVLPMPVSDWLDEWFESPALKAAVGAVGTFGSLLGPKGSGTAFMLLYHAMGAGAGGWRASRYVQGGIGQLSQALASAAQGFGAQVRTGAGVRGILLEDGRAVGVELESGERLQARRVLSSASPRCTFFELVGAPHLEVRFVREVKNIRYRGNLARVILGVRGMPQFQLATAGGSRPDASSPLSGHILICPHLEALERAYDDAKYGDLSSQPCLDLTIPTLLDASLAPPGEQVLLVSVQYAPYKLSAGNWDDLREVLAERVIATLEQYAPGIRQQIAHRRVITPLDYEQEYGLPEGCIYHGQMGLDQLLFMRPAPGYGRYATPVENLYLCGAGAHPGGGVTGASGYNAAREAMAALQSRTG